METKINSFKEQVYNLVPYVINRLNYILNSIKEAHIINFDSIILYDKDKNYTIFSLDIFTGDLKYRNDVVHGWTILSDVSIDTFLNILNANEIHFTKNCNSKNDDIIINFPANIDNINPKDKKYAFCEDPNRVKSVHRLF